MATFAAPTSAEVRARRVVSSRRLNPAPAARSSPSVVVARADADASSPAFPSPFHHPLVRRRSSQEEEAQLQAALRASEAEVDARAHELEPGSAFDEKIRRRIRGCCNGCQHGIPQPRGSPGVAARRANADVHEAALAFGLGFFRGVRH